MIISQIVAVAENGVIGKDNDLIWRLPTDLKHFKTITTGHHIIMGRKNYESIGRPLPNRTSVVITRNKEFTAPGCIVVHAIEDALDLVRKNNETEAFIIGGGEIYKSSLPVTNKIYYTEVHHVFEGDTFYPTLNKEHWKETSREHHEKDEKNNYAYSFVQYDRIK